MAGPLAFVENRESTAAGPDRFFRLSGLCADALTALGAGCGTTSSPVTRATGLLGGKRRARNVGASDTATRPGAVLPVITYCSRT